MRIRIKICGLTTPDSARAAADAGADAIGLVFAPGSIRLLDVQTAEQIINALPPFVEPIGLFVDARPGDIRQAAAHLGLRTVQLHGKETSDFAASLAPLRVIKAIAFDAEHTADSLAPWRSSAVPNLAGLLWDAPPPTLDSAVPGGHGKPFDWLALSRFKATGALDALPPMILAGGLTPENVATAIKTVQPYGVDVSSGVEGRKGVKDLARIAAFCAAVQGAIAPGPTLAR